MAYHDLDLVSNSRLSAVRSYINGQPRMKAKKETLEFGSQVHEYVLEHDIYTKRLSAREPYYAEFLNRVGGMGASARANQLVKYFLEHPKVKLEQEVFFTHQRTGLECKLKADIWLGAYIGDLKTTACKTKAEFDSTITKYGYHRQGAFYMDATGSKEFIIIAISKTFPYPTFTYNLKIDDERIIKGRAEIEILFDEYIRLKKEGVKF